MAGEGRSRYRLARPLGQGGMGVVYEAHDDVLGRRVAVKLCAVDSPEAKRQLEQEARAASRLNHPNIAQVYDYGETPDGKPFIVMEYVDGRNLSELVAGRPLAVGEAVRVAGAVAEALREAHRHGIIHRDIKPAHIRITARNQVKVLDFGLARVVPTLSGQTQTVTGAEYSFSGQIKGTPAFMSPEQARGRPVDQRTDLFSLGAVFYECLTGRRPFGGESLADTLSQVLQHDPPPPSHLNSACPPELDRIVLRLLAKDPAQRYQSAEELLRELPTWSAPSISQTVALSHTPPPAPTRPASSPSLSLTLTRRSIWLGAAVLLLAAVSVSLAVWWRTRPYRPDPRAARWYAQGIAALQDGTWLKASKALSQAVSLDPGFAVAHARLAEAWNALDCPDRAREELLRAASSGTRRLRRADALLVEAIRAGLTNEHETAIRNLIERERLVSADEKALAAFDLARAYFAAEKPAEALQALKRATDADEQFAAAHLLAGTILARQRNREAAEEALRRAEALYEASSNLEGRAEVDYQRALLAIRAGDSDRARIRALLDRVIAAAETTDNQPQKIKAQLQIVGLLLDAGETRRAEQMVNEVARLARLTGVETLYIRALVDIGNCYMDVGNYPEAASSYEEALVAARRLGSRRMEALVRANYGSLLVMSNRSTEALEHLREAVRFYESSHARFALVSALVLLGRAQRNTGDLDAAAATFARVQELAESGGNALEIAQAEQSLASIEVWRENFTEALRHFQRSRDYLGKAGSRIGGAYNNLTLGLVLARLGRFEEALAFFAEAEAYGREQKLRHLLFSAAQVRAWTYLFMGRLDEVRRQLAQMRLHRTNPAGGTTAEEIQLELALAVQAGAARSARPRCDELLGGKPAPDDPFLADSLRLLCAEVLLETGEIARAAELAAQTAERFAARGQRESEWKAWAVLARTGRDRKEVARRAAAALAALEERFSPEDRLRYSRRADVLRLRKYL